LRQFEKLE
jgi:hypothetical protein